MVRLDRICLWSLIVCFAALPWSAEWVKWIDEAVCYLLLAVGLADCVMNHRWRDYRPMMVLLAIMGIYAVYSLMKPYNTAPYIAMDYIIELKPFVPFMVLLCVRPRLTAMDRRVLQGVALAHTGLVALMYAQPDFRIYTMGLHIMSCGTTCFVSALIYLLCAIDENGRVDWVSLVVVGAILLLGLGCTRAKYYGEFVVAVFFLALYRPGMLHGVKPGYWILTVALMVIVVAVAWDKLTYYFISGNSGTGDFDPTLAESFARPALYATGALILVTEIPLGSGLASFASYASMAHYSNLYYDYGISSVYGLSEAKPDFICDAFYPSLAQFGLVGVVLFIVYWVWLFKPVRRLIQADKLRFRYHYVVAVLAVCFIMIESVASTLLMQSWGMVVMMVLGLVASINPPVNISLVETSCEHET